jgi:hypothetical protein
MHGPPETKHSLLQAKIYLLFLIQDAHTSAPFLTMTLRLTNPV